MEGVLRPARLRPGDTVRLVSPASTPEPATVERTSDYLASLGLNVEVATHVFDTLGYSRQGRRPSRRLQCRRSRPRGRGDHHHPGRKGRVPHRGPTRLRHCTSRPEAARRLQREHRAPHGPAEELWLAAVHGARWPPQQFGRPTVASFEAAVFTADAIQVTAVPHEPTAALTTTGRATGRLIGGNQDLVFRSVSTPIASPTLRPREPGRCSTGALPEWSSPVPGRPGERLRGGRGGLPSRCGRDDVRRRSDRGRSWCRRRRVSVCGCGTRRRRGRPSRSTDPEPAPNARRATVRCGGGRT